MRFSGIPPLYKVFFCLCWICLSYSCTEQKFLFFNRTTVRNFPADTPFVYANQIVVEGDLPKDEKKRLTTALEDYWEDSVRARREQRFGVFYRLRRPPRLDTMNLLRTQAFMTSFLRSQGYYYATLRDSVSIDTFKNQERATVYMFVQPGKPTIIDSFTYDIADSALQAFAVNGRGESFIQAGKTRFTTQVIGSELERLVNLYRRNGYFRFTRNDIVAEADTTDINLLLLSSDPFEQAQQLAGAFERKRNNPTVSVSIKLRSQIDSVRDSTKLVPYYNARVYFYPETQVQEFPDSLITNPNLQEITRRQYTMRYREGRFTLRPLVDHTYLPRGQRYNEDEYFRTLNNLGQVGAWVQVDGRPLVRQDSIDYHIFLVPAVKQNISVDLEASRNTETLLGSNFFGISLNTTYRNRNVWKRAVQSITSARGGVELNFQSDNKQLQTVTASFSHTYSFPRLILPQFITLNRKELEGARTIVNVNASYADRFDFFRLRSLTGGWGYEWRKGNKAWQYRPVNIELYSLDTLPKLEEAFNKNPFLRVAFNTGYVVGQLLSFNVAYNGSRYPNHSHFFRFAVEESGALAGRFSSLQDRVYQYVKLEGEYRRLIAMRKTSLAFRTLAGVGINYGKDPKIGNTLPFFKQFVAGGPNSMRAWGIRQLGLGSSLISDTSTSFRDRFGDMQLEANLEYRFPVSTIGGMSVAGAVFTDLGNIWNLRVDQADPLTRFSWKRLGRDLAIGVGTGLRLDFSYFLVRLDLGIKLKDPARLQNNGWLDIKNFTWRNEEFPQVPVRRNNYALQLGIGLPF